MSTAAILSTLPPTERRKPRSLSPRKPVEKCTRLSEPIPTRLLPTPNPPISAAVNPPFTIAFNFFDDESRKFKRMVVQDRKQLLHELRQAFPGVLAPTVSPALLYVECNPTPDTLRPSLLSVLSRIFLPRMNRTPRIFHRRKG